MTDITRTQAALVREAAEILNIVGTGQPLEAEYGEKISSRVDSLFAQLAVDGICNVANPDAIPVEWFDSLAGLLANISASIAGKTFDPQIKEYYEMQLKRLTSSGPSYRVLDSEYF